MCDDRNAELLLHTCCSSPIHFSVCWLMCCGIYFNLHDLRKTCLRYKKKGSPVFFHARPSDCICASSAQKTTGCRRVLNLGTQDYLKTYQRTERNTGCRIQPLLWHILLLSCSHWLIKTDRSWACNSWVYKTNWRRRQAMNPAQIFTQSSFY